MKGKTVFSLLSREAKSTPLLYYATVLFLPTQLGRHFWPPFSTVSGVRVDYLSPTLYVTDILIVLLAVSFFAEKRYRQFFRSMFFQIKPALFLLLALGAVTFFSQSAWLGFYGYLKVWEMLFFAAVTVVFLRENPQRINPVLSCLAVGVIAESALAIMQFWLQRSLGGPLYFLGERTFTTLTPGIATADLDGRLVLRPYGTLPHPNVLGGYLLTGMTLLLWRGTKGAFLLRRLSFLAVAIGSIGMVLSLSRVSVALWTITLIVFFFFRFPAKRLQLAVVTGGVIILFLILLPHRFFDFSPGQESVRLRVDLLGATISMLKNHWVMGVGLKQYLIALPYYFKEAYSLFYLQPVHNVFLLWLAEAGVIGAGTLFLVGHGLFRALRSTTAPLPFLLMAQVVAIGMVDHYFLTLQQGNLLLALLSGVALSGMFIQKQDAKKTARKAHLSQRREKNIRKQQIP